MGMIKNVVVAGVAKKLYDVARRPENQRKIMQMVQQYSGKGGQTGRRPGGTGRTYR